MNNKNEYNYFSKCAAYLQNFKKNKCGKCSDHPITVKDVFQIQEVELNAKLFFIVMYCYNGEVRGNFITLSDQGMESIVDLMNRVLSDRNSVHRRVGHVVVSYRHFILVWGGFSGEKIEMNMLRTEYCPSHQLWMYNCMTEVWSVELTKGQIPYMNSGSTGLVLDHYLYVFGGAEELTDEAWRYGNDLYRLDLQTLVWKRLEPKGERPVACDKSVGWVHGTRLYFFSGFGVMPRPGVGGAGRRNRGGFASPCWVRDESTRWDERGWTDQLVWYETDESAEGGGGWGEWSGGPGRGGLPSPRAASAAARSPPSAPRPLVLVFGGRLSGNRLNDLYALDLNTMKWSDNLTHSGDGGEVPDGRSWHSIDFVDTDRVIIYGGLDQAGNPSSRWWELKLTYGECLSEVRVSWKGHDMESPLIWHKSAYSKATGELVMIGGVPVSPYVMNIHDHVERMCVIKFKPSSLLRLCLKAVVKHFNNTWQSPAGVWVLRCLLPPILSDLIIARVSIA